MEKAFNLGEKLFFNVLIICIVSFICFNVLAVNSHTILLQVLSALIYFGINLYYGYVYKLTIKESLIVGIMGCGVGIFLYFFTLCSLFLSVEYETSIIFSVLYLSPIKIVLDLIPKDFLSISILILILSNIMLVVIGGLFRRIIDKIHSYMG